MDLTLATREADGRAIVAVGGEIDVYTAPKLRDKITELVGGGSYNIVIDMKQSSSSTPPARRAGRRPEEGPRPRRLAQLVCNQERLLKIFRITGLAKVFVIHDSADPSVASAADRRFAVRCALGVPVHACDVCTPSA